VTVLHFGALSDCSMSTSIDARAIVLCHGLFGGTCGRQGGSVTSCVCVLAATGDVLTQQQQHQTEASVVAVNAAAAGRVCFARKSSSSLPPISIVCTAAVVLGSFEAWRDSSNDRV